MTVADSLMLALGAIAVGFGALVVSSTHLVRAGLYLVISLGAVAGLYLVLGAELVAWVQVLVYVGAVVVLLLFAVMLTRAPIGPSSDLDRPPGPAALIGAGVGFGLAALLADAFHWTRYDLPPPGTAERVGAQIFGGWVLPFEVLSILLLAALIGAIVLSRPDLGARPDPDAATVPSDTPAPDPTAESAEVVARLERIAARQASAQARVRQAAAEQRTATADPSADPTAQPSADPAPAPTPQDVLKDKAADVIFGAQARRTPLGRNTPPEPGTPADGIIEGTATETPAAQTATPTPHPAVGPAPADQPDPSRRRPAIGPAAADQTDASRRRPAVGGRPSKPAIEGSVVPEAGRAPSRGIADRPARPALSASGQDERPLDDSELPAADDEIPADPSGGGKPEGGA